jgi:flagellar hook-length control protein FliK
MDVPLVAAPGRITDFPNATGGVDRRAKSPGNEGGADFAALVSARAGTADGTAAQTADTTTSPEPPARTGPGRSFDAETPAADPAGDREDVMSEVLSADAIASLPISNQVSAPIPSQHQLAAVGPKGAPAALAPRAETTGLARVADDEVSPAPRGVRDIALPVADRPSVPSHTLQGPVPDDPPEAATARSTNPAVSGPTAPPTGIPSIATPPDALPSGHDADAATAARFNAAGVSHSADEAGSTSAETSGWLRPRASAMGIAAAANAVDGSAAESPGGSAFGAAQVRKSAPDTSSPSDPKPERTGDKPVMAVHRNTAPPQIEPRGIRIARPDSGQMPSGPTAAQDDATHVGAADRTAKPGLPSTPPIARDVQVTSLGTGPACGIPASEPVRVLPSGTDVTHPHRMDTTGSSAREALPDPARPALPEITRPTTLQAAGLATAGPPTGPRGMVPAIPGDRPVPPNTRRPDMDDLPERIGPNAPASAPASPPAAASPAPAARTEPPAAPPGGPPSGPAPAALSAGPDGSGVIPAQGLAQAPAHAAAQFTSPGAPTSLPHHIAQHIATSLPKPIGDLGTGTVEIALDPPELGRVRMSLVDIGGTVALSIVADRPETADLMRRHLDILTQEFGRAGLDAPNVRVGTGGDGHGAQPDQGRSHAEPAKAAPGDRATSCSPTETPLKPPPDPSRALDLRL